jgi:hypothetical protein
MMISPHGFLDEHRNDSYEKLLKIRDALIREIRAFERKKIPTDQWMICPSPEVIYQMNLQYLSVLCDYIAERYNNEFVNCDDDQ